MIESNARARGGEGILKEKEKSLLQNCHRCIDRYIYVYIKG
jgi:hypothetical protein